MRTIETSRERPVIAVITDLHGSKDAARRMEEHLQEKAIDAIVLAGDTPDNTKENLRWMLQRFKKTEVPIIIFPGSHENSFTYKQVLQKFRQDNTIIDGMRTQNRRVRIEGFELLLIPGSSVVSSGSKPYNGGNMWLVDEKKNPRTKALMTRRIKRLQFAKKAEPFFMEDVRKLISARTKIPRTRQIAIAHEPLRCRTKRGIDTAHFGRSLDEFTISAKQLKKMKSKQTKISNIEREFSKSSVLPFKDAKLLQDHGYPIECLRKNVGSKAIQQALKKHNITKFLCGHLHEAGPKAIDKRERKIREKTWNKVFYANSGPAYEGNLTLLTLRKDGAVKHEFVNVNPEKKEKAHRQK